MWSGNDEFELGRAWLGMWSGNDEFELGRAWLGMWSGNDEFELGRARLGMWSGKYWVSAVSGLTRDVANYECELGWAWLTCIIQGAGLVLWSALGECSAGGVVLTETVPRRRRRTTRRRNSFLRHAYAESAACKNSTCVDRRCSPRLILSELSAWLDHEASNWPNLVQSWV